MHSVCKTSVSGNDRQEDGCFISTAFKMRFQPFSFIPFVHEQPELYARPICPETIGRICNPLYVEVFAPATAIASRNPLASVIRLRFIPCFPRSVGFLPVFFEPASGNLTRLHPLKDSMRSKLKQAGWSDKFRSENIFG